VREAVVVSAGALLKKPAQQGMLLARKPIFEPLISLIKLIMTTFWNWFPHRKVKQRISEKSVKSVKSV